MNLKLIRVNDKTRFVCLLFVFVAAVLFFEDTGLLDGINRYCYDLCFRFRGERRHDDRIIIAAIDENTLAKLGRWPIRRSHYAALLDHLNQAAAVGIDIILSEPSEDDRLLSDAIIRQGKVVLPVYIDSLLNISTPTKSLSSAASGHVHLEQDIDGFVREVYHTLSHRSDVIPSFASALVDVIDDKVPARPKTRGKLPTKENFTQILQTDNMWVNYYGAPGTIRYCSVVDILEGQWPPAFFADKIVLVGKTTAGLHEGILIPYSNGSSRMPAVEVHAHVLNNLLENGPIRPVGRGLRWTLATVLAVFCFFVFIRSGNLNDTIIGLLSLLAITLITFINFATFNVWLLPASLYLSVGVSFLLAYFFNLQKMKQLLLQAKENWEESFNTINDAICIYDNKGNIIQANHAAGQIFGPSVIDFLKQKYSQNCFENGTFVVGTNTPITEEGFTEEAFHPEQNRYLEIKSLPRFDKNHCCKGIVQVVRDITENKMSEKEHRRLQEQLIQAQKMEAIGTLAGGIAHDFNNILSAVMGYTELTLLALPEKGQMRDQLNHVLKASQRAKELVGQILTFSRQTTQSIQPQAVELGMITKEALKLIKSTFPSTIRLHLEIVSQGMAVIDPSQMHQIIMNLCTNAKHAMQENGGVLTVTLNDIDIEPQTKILDRNPDLHPGPYIELAVKDTGSGMAPEVMRRIFEPYFTTKEKNVGTGLGLAMVHGIAKNYGGAVLLESQLGKGTAFYIYLPRTDSDPALKETGEDIASLTAPTGTERILFVDDELPLISLGRNILETMGYRVVTKKNGVDALKEFSEKPDYFDAVVTDMTMPQMTGKRLAQELIRIRPEIPIILCTGFSEQINEQESKLIGIKAFLMKPLTINRLAKTLRGVLDSQEGKQDPPSPHSK